VGKGAERAVPTRMPGKPVGTLRFARPARPIASDDDVAAGLAALLVADPRLKRVALIAGGLPLRRREGGFEGLASVITGQQISTHAAAAIWTRFRAAVDPFTPDKYLATSEEALRAAGLSFGKIRTLTGIATACGEGLDLDALHDLPPEEAIAIMTTLKGVGRWTAESYLLFCVGHPDVFPAGDLALQTAVHRGLRLRQRPDEKKLRKLAEKWTPWRGVAARLFWAYYRADKAAKTAT
jgi:DNA-3-methyladenine glycosylase II